MLFLFPSGHHSPPISNSQATSSGKPLLRIVAVPFTAALLQHMMQTVRLLTGRGICRLPGAGSFKRPGMILSIFVSQLLK